MATSKAPKSILKKTSYPYPTTTTTTTSRSKEDRDREVALYHANLLQERKNIELEILLSMETLIDYPLSRGPPYSASNPSPTDMQTFKDLLQPFQPSDYDALIIERNINENCGYTLCPNARATDGRGGKYRILGMSGKAKDFRVVERHEVEKWCSEACARRALYVRVQLSESPAWERAGGISSQIDLLDEPKSMQDQIAEDFAKMDLAEVEGKMQDATDLALERGDRGLGAKQGRVEITIQEKDVQRPAQPPSIEVNALGERLDSMHLTLEGHTPNFSSGKNRQHDDLFGDDDEDSGQDWL